MSISPCRTTLRRASAAIKRPHSPEPMADRDDTSSKRVKTTIVARVAQESPTLSVVSRVEAKKERDRKRELEFKAKYSRAFPGFVFYFDLDTGNPEIEATRANLVDRVKYMKAEVHDFFSKDVTHFITLHDVDEKENKEKEAKGSALGSPIRLRGRNTMGESLLQKARTFDIKFWSVAKLHTVLDRCDTPRVTSAIGALSTRAQRPSRDRNLARLLETERLHGTTERDPSQRRHDYIYFSKDSYFVLVEDIRGELATITATEYPIQRTKDGKEKGSWPVLHLHPLARGPFLEYDDKEERRRQKTDKAEQDRQAERARRKARLQHERKQHAQLVRRRSVQHPDLRRCASMNNLQRRATFPATALNGYVDLDEGFGEDIESANASGYLASAAYMAASGNSVSITSTTGTTSAAGGLLRTLQLPPHLKEKMQQQVTMQRRASALPPPAERNKENVMGPPTTIPDRAKFLRKSKSTNTLKLPKRDEQSKPGYCECCRVKFENFKDHIVGRKHRKFAMDDNNFKHLDAVLSRVKRRTVEEVEEANERFLAEALAVSSSTADVDEHMLPQPEDEDIADDVHWDEWVDAAKCESEIEA
ncbi:hypothetical protein K466DRAFT_560990 [Polyporus arcularius HHB13444]|uniref:DBF4-type domain-containing protein n=1 Tax=Polyporus arcularius HHB13444 TaxID=1314778 RepID=A0A5C3PXQ2_9APHY|nr:hypothetical protein K466DRAFT_560990 [Polyporus arcularius HHB13444]